MAVLFRKAGLPTRTVIAWDVSGDNNNRFLKDSKKANKLRSWVEFYLFDDANNAFNWVPVDVVGRSQIFVSPARWNPTLEVLRHHG